MRIEGEPPDQQFKNVSYPETRKSVEDRKCFKWVHYFEGQVAKILICKIIDERIPVSQRAVGARYKSFGITGESLFDFFKRNYTAIFPAYRNVTGNELTPHILYERGYNAFYNHTGKGKGGERVGSGKEHMDNRRRKIDPEAVKLADKIWRHRK